jgi:cytochrome c biogenesis protein CcmG, thiol:disulfide interchange protein DsbE
MMRRRLAAALIAVAAACAACGGGSSHSVGGSSAATTNGNGPPVTKDPSTSSLVKAAHLPPCPTSASTAASHGLPDVTLDCLGNGPAVHVAGLTGTPTVVNMWAAWCIPCHAELPYFDALSAHRGVRVLGVDTEDTDGNALSFAAAYRPALRYPSVTDPSRRVLTGVKADNLPTTAFLDAAGAVVHVHTGPYNSAAQLRQDVATYLHVTA